MESTTISNFFISTKGIFKGCKIPKRKPDYTSYCKSIYDGSKMISSRYWYGSDKKGEYVIRDSNHWVKRYDQKGNLITSDCKSIKSCFWSIKSTYQGPCLSGKVYLKNLKKVVFRNL